MRAGKIDPKQGLIPFAIVVVIMSSLLFVYLYLGREPVAEAEGFRAELAEGFGSAGLWALAIIYGRSVLKMALNEGTLLERFIPVYYQELSVSASRKVLNILNRTHKHVGAFAVAILAGHAALMGTVRWNLFLEMVLALLVWQGVFGLFLVVRFPPASLRRYGYLVHAQLFSGVMIGVFAGFGHLLVGD
ncbi:hypothetical protein OR1_01861 [Geobacter sp. OR-1]|uniref:hypothetical protein n=1 Tax=Geobacter sp. OR-1 TaxID=1266765 RepID=UPI000542308E|nr:hypothetical protein [Geobacter sp. OR-1]GAM09581.1 hypothetical protein OR1_01861 [Geobacter sp. OR-1]